MLIVDGGWWNMPCFCYGNINLGCSSHVIVLLLQKKWQILNLNPNLKFVFVRRGNHEMCKIFILHVCWFFKWSFEYEIDRLWIAEIPTIHSVNYGGRTHMFFQVYCISGFSVIMKINTMRIICWAFFQKKNMW